MENNFLRYLFKFNTSLILIKFFANLYLEDGCECPMDELPVSDRLRFDRFDICRLLKNGASLLGSAGAEFEVQDDTSGTCSFNICNIKYLNI